MLGFSYVFQLCEFENILSLRLRFSLPKRVVTKISSWYFRNQEPFGNRTERLDTDHRVISKTSIIIILMRFRTDLQNNIFYFQYKTHLRFVLYSHFVAFEANKALLKNCTVSVFKHMMMNYFSSPSMFFYFLWLS